MAVGSLEIEGGAPLCGEIRIQGSKNAVLPVLAACMLGDGPCVIENCPEIQDVEDTLEILQGLGCSVQFEEGTVRINASGATGYEINGENAARIRSSILFLGALLGKMKKAILPQPGGCAIGRRPIDLHIASLEQLGVLFARKLQSWELEEGRDGEAAPPCISASGALWHGGTVRLRFPSVGATENLILASVLQEGETVIQNAAREPEIEELCRFLNLRGARVRREAGGDLRILGVRKLYPITYQMKADRIVTGTYLLAAAAAGGSIRILNFPEGELEALLKVLARMGSSVRKEAGYLQLDCAQRPAAAGLVATAPYPGFPTDLQSPLMAVCALADGRSCIQETIFENRFRTARELVKMGAQIQTKGDCAWITGVHTLHGARVEAPDLRGGAALVIAALAARGRTVICHTDYIARGYEDICRDLSGLGAKLRFCEEFRAEET